MLFLLTLCEADTSPCGELSADAVAVQTDVGVTLLKQGQHLPCGAVLVQQLPTGDGERKNNALLLCVCVCVFWLV